jgi:Immunity protein 44
MELWMSAEVWGDVDTSLRKVSRHIEEVVNGSLGARDYGEGVRKWALIAILLPPDMQEDYPERFKYHKSDKTLEFRLRIDLKTFRKADESNQKRLVSEALLQSLDILDQKKVPNFDHHKLRADFLEIAKRQHWLN